uniref:Conopeptide Mi048 n=1 Tax=Conus miles TaxID=69564 RepID=A0A0E3X2D5_CONMI|nr:conopeptide Mi048 [Conus miles]
MGILTVLLPLVAVLVLTQVIVRSDQDKPLNRRRNIREAQALRRVRDCNIQEDACESNDDCCLGLFCKNEVCEYASPGRRAVENRAALIRENKP